MEKVKFSIQITLAFSLFCLHTVHTEYSEMSMASIQMPQGFSKALFTFTGVSNRATGKLIKKYSTFDQFIIVNTMVHLDACSNCDLGLCACDRNIFHIRDNKTYSSGNRTWYQQLLQVPESYCPVAVSQLFLRCDDHRLSYTCKTINK